jgi:hypothetical protein
MIHIISVLPNIKYSLIILQCKKIIDHASMQNIHWSFFNANIDPGLAHYFNAVPNNSFELRSPRRIIFLIHWIIYLDKIRAKNTSSLEFYRNALNNSSNYLPRYRIKVKKYLFTWILEKWLPNNSIRWMNHLGLRTT